MPEVVIRFYLLQIGGHPRIAGARRRRRAELSAVAGRTADIGREQQWIPFSAAAPYTDELRQECILEASSDRELVLQAATSLAGDRARAWTWYLTQALSPFEGKTADALVREGRSADVIRLIHSYSAGSLG